jgi:predicted nuclease of predicted toxin-antitoxin system
MKLLLDENLPKRLKQDFTEFEIFTTADLGWTGVTNGRLLELLIANNFNALLTFDKNLQHQQNFTRYSIAVLVIEASDNRYQT